MTVTKMPNLTDPASEWEVQVEWTTGGPAMPLFFDNEESARNAYGWISSAMHETGYLAASDAMKAGWKPTIIEAETVYGAISIAAVHVRRVSLMNVRRSLMVTAALEEAHRKMKEDAGVGQKVGF